MSTGKARTFDPKAFLIQIGLGRTILRFSNHRAIFKQGDLSDAVFYIQKGRVKLAVLSSRGRKATIALLGEGDFIGEGCIASDQPVRVASAIAVAECLVLRIEKHAMLDVLHREHFRICWLHTWFAAIPKPRKIWWITYLTPPRSGWLVLFSC